MHILIVSATDMEISPLIRAISDNRNLTGAMYVKHLITGVGMVSSTYELCRYLCKNPPQLVIIAGIAGTFNDKYPPGSVVAVGSEIFADTGAEDNGSFMDLFNLGLSDPDEFPFIKGLLVNTLRIPEDLDLPLVKGCTVSRISDKKEWIKIINQKYSPDIESMEGAAFQYVCIKEKIPFLHIRGISNYTGERDKSKWKIPEAIRILNDTVYNIIQDEYLLSTLIKQETIP